MDSCSTVERKISWLIPAIGRSINKTGWFHCSTALAFRGFSPDKVPVKVLGWFRCVCVFLGSKKPLQCTCKIATNWRWISYFKAEFSPHVILLLNKKYIPSYPRQIYPENGPCYTWKFGQTRKLQSVGWTILNAHYLLTRTPLMVKSPFFHRKIPISVN